MSAQRRHLAASVALVQARLEDLARRKRGESDGGEAIASAQAVLEAATRAIDGEAPLDVFAASFRLNEFERALLLLCIGAELDPEWGALCAAAGASSRPWPHFALAFEAFPDADWSALAPEGALRRWHIVECAGKDGLAGDRLTVDPRVLHHLLGHGGLDGRLLGTVQHFAVTPPEDSATEAFARRLAASWQAASPGQLVPVVLLSVGDAVAKAGAACARIGLAVHRMDATALPLQPGEQLLLARLWAREAVLSGSVLLIDGELAAERQGALARFLDSLHGLVILISPSAPPGLQRAVARLDLPQPSYQERLGWWREALGPLGPRLNGSVEAVATQFQIDGAAIRVAAGEAARLFEGSDETSWGATLWNVSRGAARPRLDSLAARIETKAGWDDLVLPEAQLAALRMIVAQTRSRARVYEDWGFGDAASRGLGMAALFAGPSGTGKTMAAEVIARALSLDLYRIDLSQIVSKYIGETEKNLSRVFDAADSGGAILLFDEADALFGKRSEVRDSHDRYANIEVGYLLQRIEAYRGLAILTTNMQQAIDGAFLRRLRFIVNFPFPDLDLRRRIWERAFPARAPLGQIDSAKLARLALAGGSIRNMALNAAFLAADENAAVGMRHLRLAAQAEYIKLDKPLSDNEIGGWA